MPKKITLFRTLCLLALMLPWTTAHAYDDQYNSEQGYIMCRILPKETLYLYEKPTKTSFVTDTIKWERGFPDGLRLMKDVESGWCEVRYRKSQSIYDEKGMFQYDTTYYHTRYVERSMLERKMIIRYLVEQGVSLYAHTSPDSASPISDTLTSGIYVAGNTADQWVKVLVHTKESELKHQYAADEYKAVRYIDGDIFRKNCTIYVEFPDDIDYSTSGKTGLTPEWVNLQNEWHKKLGVPLDAEHSFPVVALIMILLIVIAPIITRNNALATMILQYVLMIAIILMELSYTLLFGYEFWFCKSRGGFTGWLVGAFFTLFTLGFVFVQYFYFFNLIQKLKNFSRNFSTWIGTTIPVVFIIGALIYAIFSPLSTSENETMIYILLGTQVLQIAVIGIQMYRYPIYGLMAIILVPLGTVAIIMTSLMAFQFAVILALILVGFKGVMGIASASSDHSSSDTKDLAYVDVARTCAYFSESGFRCKFHAGECSMCYIGTCKHGQM